MAISGPNAMRIHKKTAANDYLLYHPQTGDTEVLIGSARWDGVGFIPTALYQATGASTVTTSASATWVNNNKSSYPYVKLSEYLLYINDQINNFGGVIEFAGIKTYSTLPTTGTTPPVEKGQTFVVSDEVYWRSTTSDAWKKYAANTLFLYSGENTGYVNNTNASGNGKGPGWYPLGGSNDLYALKSEALKTVTLSGATLTFGYADNTSTHTTSVTFSTIGTVAASTTTITSDINSATDSAIPNVAAIKAYAGSAGYIDTVAEGAEGSSYYLVGAAVSGAHTHQSAISSDIKITHHTNGNDSIAVDISGKAATADMVANGLTIDGLTYNGSSARTVTFGNGIFTTLSADGSSLEVGVNTGNGLTHDASNNLAVYLKSTNSGLEFDNNGGLAANPGTGITLDSNGISIAGTHTISAGSGITITGTATYRGTGATTTVGVKGDASKGITVDASAGVGINAGNGIGFSNNQLTTKVSGALTYDASGNIFVRELAGNPVTVSTNGVALGTSGIAAGVYSAIEVDTYGLAKSGGQAVVFAENMQDHDLESLVIGGLAFVGNEATATDSTYTTNSGTPRIG